jgi:uncharacterized Zn-binding protein involved in type VI secretion
MPGRPAARILDPVVHPLPGMLTPGPGSPNVIIGGKLAWRGVLAAAATAIQAAKKVADTTVQIAEKATLAATGTPGMPAAKAAEQATKATVAASMASMISGAAGGADIHACMTPSPLPPHGPGVVIDGSQTVLINGLAACRQGDTIVEPLGPPDKIAMGLPTVLIGDATPTASELQNNPTVQAAMAQAWQDSQPNDPLNRHEEGGWVYMNPTTGAISVVRQTAGQTAGIDLSQPPDVPGAVVVAKFHTHPNPTADGWLPGPSPQDVRVDAQHGVPDLIQADDGVHVSGPDSRRGGLGGGSGFPP